MTVAVNLATVADSISKLSVSGITIKDIDQIPESAEMLCPLLIPQPNGFITDIRPTFETFGSNGAAKMNLEYTLNYVFLHSQIGSGINTYASYSDLIADMVLIIVSIMSNDVITGLVDIRLQSIGNIGVIPDPADNEYWGIQFSFRVMEYVQ
jgi:hypothetical protein